MKSLFKRQEQKHSGLMAHLKLSLIAMLLLVFVGMGGNGWAASLVAAYNFDEGTGNLLFDQSGLNKTGTKNDTPTYSADVPTGGGSYSLYFNGGATTQASMGGGTEFTGNHDFTVSFWMKYQPQASRQWVAIIGQLTTNNGIHWLINPNGDTQFGWMNGTQNAFNMSAYANQWVLLTTTWNAATNTIKTYLNNLEVDSDVGVPVNLAHQGIVLGYKFGGEATFLGNFDNIKIWDYVNAPSNTYTATATATGDGSGSVTSSTGGISYIYPANSTGTSSAIMSGMTVTLTATAGSGSIASWDTCTGTVAGNGTSLATCTYPSIDGNKSAQATFTLSSATINNGLLFYYPMDGSGADLSGQGRIATNYGTTATTDRFGNANSALSFNGSSNYLQAPPFPISGPYTISAWVQNTRNADWTRLIDFGNGGGSNNLIVGWGYGGFLFHHTYNGASYQSTQSATIFPFNSWTHVTVVNNGSNTAQLYHNGTLISSGPAYSPSALSRTYQYIGKSNWADPYYQGKMDELRMYNRVLTGAEITTLASSFALSVAKSGTGAANGTITSSTGTLSWSGNDGTATYNGGAMVTLTASSGNGTTFAGWSGACSGTGACTVTMDAAKSVTATFTSSTYTATATATGNGSGLVSSTIGGISYSYQANNTGTTSALNAGTSVTLTADAATGSTVAWTTCSGTTAGNGTTAATCTYSSLDGDKTAQATFSLNQYTVTPSAGEGIITTFAGTGSAGYSGDGGAATSADLRGLYAAAADSSGNVYIADTLNHCIRKVDTSGTITTFAGTGAAGYSGDGGAATSAKLQYPQGVAVDATGNVYIGDSNNHRVRKVDSQGTITTFAGNGTGGYAGDNGAATLAQLYQPTGIAVGPTGDIFIVDTANNRIRKVNGAGTITTFAGNGTQGYAGDNGPATSAQLYWPPSVAVDATGNVYIGDTWNHRVRKVDGTGTITTFAGTGSAGSSGDGGPATSAQLYYPRGVAVDSLGNVYIGDRNNFRIRKVSNAGTMTTFAGNGSQGFSGDGGAATSAQLNNPFGVATDSTGNVYIADSDNNRVRKVSVANGSFSPSTAQTVNYGASTSFTVTPNTGYHIDTVTGCNGTLTDSTYTTGAITADCVVTASFAINTYTVTYDGNGSTGGTAPTDGSSPYNYNSTVTVLGNTGSLVKTGYTFSGWNTAANGSGTAYSASSTFNIVADMSLYAQWIINTYAVTYQTDGTSGATLTGTTPQTINHGSDATAVTANAPIGYHFVNWTGTGGFVTTTDNPLTVTNVTADMAITANYAINTYTITASADPLAGGGVSCSPNPVDHGSTSTCTITTNAGYTLQGVTGTCGGTLFGDSYTTDQITSACTVTAEFAQIPPAAPNGLAATGTGPVGLAWSDNATNEDGYKIYRRTSVQVAWTEIADLGADTTTYTDSAAQADKTYYYMVKAYNSGGSAVSNQARITTGTINAPDTVRVDITPGGTDADISWKDRATNENGYRIYRRKAGEPKWTLITIPVLPAGAEAHTDSGIAAGNLWFYQICATTAGGGSACSNPTGGNGPSGITATERPMAAPMNGSKAEEISNRPAAAEIDLAWQDNSTDETGFKVYRRLSTDNMWTLLDTLPANSEAYTDTTPLTDTTYNYMVAAVNSMGSVAGDSAKITTDSMLPPDMIRVANGAEGTADLLWRDRALGEDGYSIWRKSKGSGGWNSRADIVADSTAYTDSGVTGGIMYNYQICATTAVGGSACSTPVGLNGPSGLTLTYAPATGVTLDWTDNSTDEDGFNLWRNEAGSWIVIGDIGADSVSHIDGTAVSGTSYKYKVCAYNSAVTGACSGAKTITLP